MWTADLAWGPFNQNKVKLSLRQEAMKYTTNTSFPNVLQREKPEDDDDAKSVIAETRQYLADADELLRLHTTALDFVRAMLDRYPKRLNPGAL